MLSEDAAKKQFGTTDAVGKRVMLKDYESDAFVPYKVTAVAKRSPQNSSLRLVLKGAVIFKATLFADALLEAIH